MTTTAAVGPSIDQFRDRFLRITQEVGRRIVGHEEVVNLTVTSLLAGGHVLLEGIPGVGKTSLVHTLADVMHLTFARIQFTPDLMPADIVGTNIVQEHSQGGTFFEFQQGPVFGNMVLADEINRATPKTQSALLEAMQEKSVTVGGKRYLLDEPFFVLATQNPIEMEGTYPLPEAQVDRFLFKVQVPASKLDELMEVIDRTTGKETAGPQPILTGKEILEMRALAKEVPIASHVKEFAARLVLATHPGDGSAMAKKYLRYGSSPRGAQSLVRAAKILALMKGRYNVAFSDLKEAAFPALRHRMILNFEAEAEGIRADAILEKILTEIPEVAAAK